MGKALLIIVLGGGIVLGRQLLSNQATEIESRQDQADYEEEVLAREIARSAFNVAMGTARQHPGAIDAAVTAIHGLDGTADSAYAGEANGGEFRVRASTLTGHSLQVTATGYFGGYFNEAGQYVKRNRAGREVPAASYTMSDNYRIQVLEVHEDGELDVSFLSSIAGYCSSVFVQEYFDGELVSTRMVFAAGNNRDGATPGSKFYVRAGTQLSFFIGVDQNCSMRPSNNSTCALRQHIMGYAYNPAQYRADGTRTTSGVGDWDYVHHALDIPVGAMERTTESIWALVEQHPDNRQLWRVAWEDIHNTSWNNPTSSNPRASLQALKRQGYDTNGDGSGEGWIDRDERGYRQLLETNLDLNDQVVQIGMRPLASPAEREALRQAMLAERAACGITSTEGLPPSTAGEGDGEPPPPPCACPTASSPSRKVSVMHRTPGSTGSRSRVCVTPTDAQTHLRSHDDYIECQGP
jgi:hypothetical protein